MKTLLQSLARPVACALAFLLTGALVDATTTINSTNKFAYGANLGWMDWRGDINNGAVIGDYVCSGSIYAANAGWITLGSGTPVNGIRYQNNSAADFGVNNDELGNLRGLAYGANIGWVNFESTGAPKVDLVTGKLSGLVYSANCGWISLSNSFALVQTETISITETDGDGISDNWERLYFGNLTTANATSNFDGDSLTDKQEYLAHTNPIDPNESAQPPRITDITILPDGMVRIQYSANPNSHYALYRGEDLSSICSVTQAGMATSNFGEFMEPFRPDGATFYRVAGVPPGTEISTCPFTISLPGVYILAVDCAVTAPGVTAIGIQANDVYLNLNGHTISGPVRTISDLSDPPANNSSSGIDVSGSNVRIYNGTVQGFGRGIILPGVASHDNHLNGLTVTSNRQGILLFEYSVNNQINCNNVSGNFEIGVMINRGSDQNQFNSNVVTNNGGIVGGAGIFIQYSKGNVIATNNISGNTPNPGVRLIDSHDNIIRGNTVNGNFYDGIRIDTGSGNILQNNTARGNAPDLGDYNLPASCINTWTTNTFLRDNELGLDFGPGAGCIQ